MSFLPLSDPSSLLLFLLEVVLKGSVVLAAAGLATSLLRKSPAAFRHTIWTTALAAVVVLPAIVAYTPKMDVGVLPVREIQVNAGAIQTDGERVVERADARENAHAVASGRHRQEPRSATTPHAKAPDVHVESGSPAPKSDFDWKLGLLVIWAAGAIVVFFRYFIGWIALARIKKRSEPVADIRFRLAAIKVSRSMGLHRRVRFVWGDSGGMPLTWGWIKPTVLLPQDAREWEAEKILSVLRHELAHIKRYDCFVQGLVYLVCAVYWFNPLVWIAASRSRREREIACDDYVLTSGTAGTEYADHLLDIARSLRAPRLSGASTIAMARQSELEGRLMAILSSDRHRGANTRTGMFATMGMLAVVAVPLAALRPVPADQNSRVEADVGLEVRNEPRTESIQPDDVRVFVDSRPVAMETVNVDLAPDLFLETEEYLAQVNEIVEKATRTIASIERLEPTASVWQAEFGGIGEELTPFILDQIIGNPDTIPLTQIRHLKAAGVNVDYIKELASVGLDHLTVDQLVSLAHANIDGDYVSSLRAVGYSDIQPEGLMQLGFANVDPGDIAVWAKVGYDDLSTGELIRLAHADVDAEFVTAMARLGYKDLGPDELIRMSHAEVDPEFVAELRRAGYTDLTADDLIRMAHASVNPRLVTEMASAGYNSLTPNDLIRLGHADVDAEFVDEMHRAGLKKLTIDDLVRLNHADMDAAFIQELRDLDFEVDNVDEIVRLKYMEIDPEYIQRVGKTLEDN